MFVTVLGHDLRNPLASIAAAMRLLAREPLGKNAADVLTLMQGSTHRMAQMIDNVLDFARSRLGGGIGLVRRPDQLEPLIRQVVEELLFSVPHAVIQAEIFAPHPVFLDAGRIGQMMSNLVGNALTHGDLSQPVRINATTFEDGSCEIPVTNCGTVILRKPSSACSIPLCAGWVRRIGKALALVCTSHRKSPRHIAGPCL